MGSSSLINFYKILKTITNQKRAYLFALIAVLFWSTMSSAFKLSLRTIEFDRLLFWSAIFGVITLFFINHLGKNPLKLKKLSTKNWIASAIMGFFNPFLYYMVLFKAYELLEAQIAGALNYTWPLTLVVMSAIFLKQKINYLSYIAIIISFIGIVIISTKGNFSDIGDSSLLGIILAIGSSIFWASYWIMNIKDSREETGKIMLNMAFGVVYIFIYMILTSRSISFPTGYALIGCIYIGLFEMSITFVIWLLALKNSINTAKVSNLIFLAPFIALIFISLTVKETIHITTLIGLVFIIGGILFQKFIKTSS